MSVHVRKRVLQEQLDYLCRHLLTGLAIQPVAALLLVIIAGLPVFSSPYVTAWLCLHMLISCVHYTCSRKWHGTQHNSHEYQYMAHVGLASFHGLLWGSSIWLLHDTAHHNQTTLILMCLVTISAANMFVYSAFRMTALCVATTLWLPVIAWLAMHGDLYWIAGILGFVFVQAIFNLQAYRIMVSELVERDHNNALLQQLDVTNKALNRSNSTLAEKNLALEEALSKIESLANFDSLTGSPNRRNFVRSMSKRLASGDTGFVALLDIHALQYINEQHGHTAGDDVLQKLGMQIAKGSGDEDLHARLSGGTFILFMNSSRLLAMQSRFDEIVSSMNQYAEDAGFSTFHISAGITVVSQYEPLDNVLARAEEALRKAKLQGQNRIALA